VFREELGDSQGDSIPVQKSAEGIVCAGQRPDQVGWSPTGALVRSAISKGGGNASLAGGGPISETLNGHEAGNGGYGQGSS